MYNYVSTLEVVDCSDVLLDDIILSCVSNLHRQPHVHHKEDIKSEKLEYNVVSCNATANYNPPKINLDTVSMLIQKNEHYKLCKHQIYARPVALLYWQNWPVDV